MSDRETACCWCRRLRLGATWTDHAARTHTPVAPVPCPRCAGAQRLADLHASFDSLTGSFSAMAEAGRVASSEFARVQLRVPWRRRLAAWAADFGRHHARSRKCGARDWDGASFWTHLSFGHTCDGSHVSSSLHTCPCGAEWWHR